jgi:hypothetical protein
MIGTRITDAMRSESGLKGTDLTEIVVLLKSPYIYTVGRCTIHNDRAFLKYYASSTEEAADSIIVARVTDFWIKGVLINEQY